MSGDRHDVDSRIVLPAGMELVVPPPASEPLEASKADAGRTGAPADGSSADRKPGVHAPFVHPGEPRQAPAA